MSSDDKNGIMNQQENRVNWDNEAQKYQKTVSSINSYNEQLIYFLKSKCGLRPGLRVLDIGCGAGKYGILFGQLGCDVTLLDISPKMLAYASGNMEAAGLKNWRTICIDWSEIDLHRPELDPPFDLAISTMSPALSVDGAIQKMSSITKGWCFTTQFRTYTDPLTQKLCGLLLLPYSDPFADAVADCANRIRSVSETGCTPLTTVREYNWSDDRTAEEVAERFSSNREDCAKEDVLAAVRELQGDRALLTDAIKTTVLWLYWDTRERKCNSDDSVIV